MAVKRTLTITIEIDGVREILVALRRVDKKSNQELKDRSKRIADVLARKIKAEALTAPAPQAALLSRTVRVRRDRFPVVVAGGTRALGRYRVPAYRLLFAAEFGMNERSGWYAKPEYDKPFLMGGGRQYPRHAGQNGYWFFPTARDDQPRINREWTEAAREVIEAFGGGG